MGQYYRVYNLTKKEFISPHALNDGANLLELNNTATALCILLSNSNGRGGGDLNVHHPYDKQTFEPKPTPESMERQRKVDAIAGRWAGDKIVIQGDYADKGDTAFLSEKKREGFTCINDLVIEGMSVDSYLAGQLGGLAANKKV